MRVGVLLGVLLKIKKSDGAYLKGVKGFFGSLPRTRCKKSPQFVGFFMFQGIIMAKVVSLKSHKQKVAKEKSKGLCRHGFHKWKILQEKRFEVSEGKLVTVYQCEHCKKQKVKKL